jgi:hypothetical protein
VSTFHPRRHNPGNGSCGRPFVTSPLLRSPASIALVSLDSNIAIPPRTPPPSPASLDRVLAQDAVVVGTFRINRFSPWLLLVSATAATTARTRDRLAYAAICFDGR